MKLTINIIAEVMFFISIVIYAISFLGMSYEDMRGVVDLDSTLWHTLFIYSALTVPLTVVTMIITDESLRALFKIEKED